MIIFKVGKKAYYGGLQEIRVNTSTLTGKEKQDAWGFLFVCAPIVVLGAPFGSFLGSHFHRLTLASIIYVIDAAQLIGALYVVQPWSTKKTSTPLHLSMTSLVMFVSGMIFFRLLSYFGLKLIEKAQATDEQSTTLDVKSGGDSTIERKVEEAPEEDENKI